MVGTVIVGAAGRERRQSESLVPGADEVVSCGLAGGVGAVGLESIGFSKGGCILRKASIDLVRAHLQEAESHPFTFRQPGPIRSGGFEQSEAADHIGLDEIRWCPDRAVHMAFGGEVHDGARAESIQEVLHQDTVRDVALDEMMVRVSVEGCQVFPVAGIGQLVEVDHGLATQREPVQYEIAADEACATRDQYRHKEK